MVTIKVKANPKPIQNRARKLSAEAKYYLFQRVIGAITVLFGIIAGALIESVAPLLFGITFGLCLLFTKQKVIMIGKVYWDENPIENKED